MSSGNTGGSRLDIGTICLRLPIVTTTHFGMTSGAGVILDTNPCFTYNVTNGSGMSLNGKHLRISAFNSSNLLGHNSMNLNVNITTRFNGVVTKLSNRFKFISIVSGMGNGGLGLSVDMNCGF